MKQSKYRQIFCKKNYNISLFKPKKDQCSVCEYYNRSKESGNVNEEIDKEYKQHQLNNTSAREEQELDKKMSKESPGYYTATCADYSLLYHLLPHVEVIWYLTRKM